jgi:predicted ATPase
MPGRSHPISFEIPQSMPFAGTTLIGRAQELKDISRSVASARLVTLAGPGGVGKSHLALAVAQQLASNFPDGIGWVDLTEARDLSAIRDALCKVLGLDTAQPLASAAAAIRAARRLIVLDGCEHVAETVASMVAPLCDGGLRILATSLLPLKLAGESVERIGPLALPRPGSPWETMRCSPAVKLFLVRMLERATDRTIDEGTALAIGEICRRLDGVPLSIELAAENAALLGPHAVLHRLDGWMLNMATVRRDRRACHRSLRALSERDCQLLEPAERLAFYRLSVYGGGFSFGAAHAVVADLTRGESGTTGLLERLIARSMLLVDWTADGLRYRLSSAQRALALQELDQSGELEEAASRQLGYLCVLARQAQTATGIAGYDATEALAPELTGLLESMMQAYGRTHPAYLM